MEHDQWGMRESIKKSVGHERGHQEIPVRQEVIANFIMATHRGHQDGGRTEPWYQRSHNGLVMSLDRCGLDRFELLNQALASQSLATRCRKAVGERFVPSRKTHVRGP